MRDEDTCRTIRESTSAAMKRRAKRTTCPHCKRQNAIVKIIEDGITIGRTCRYCNYEKAR